MTATKSPVVYYSIPTLIQGPGPGIYPNPFSDQALIYVRLSADAEVHLAVYNVAGEKVRTLQQACQRGMNKVVWVGDNNYGARCASGYYIIRLLADAKQGNQHDSRWLRAVITR
jgi:flagellar hook assembly protein FlgD